MKKELLIKKAFYLILPLLFYLMAGFLSGSLHAACTPATYYIDYSAANDSGAATKLDPWKRSPVMNGFSGSYSQCPGDNFIYKGGVTWLSICFAMQLLDTQGTAGAVIYHGVDLTWYSGAAWSRPVFDGEGAALTGAQNIIKFGYGIHSELPEYVELDNFEIKGLLVNSNSNTLMGSIAGVAGRGITMRNLYVHGWTYDPSVTVDQGQNGGITFSMGWGLPYQDEGKSLIDSHITGIDSNKAGGTAVYGVQTIQNSTIHDAPGLAVAACNVTGSLLYNSLSAWDAAAHENTLYVWPKAAGCTVSGNRISGSNAAEPVYAGMWPTDGKLYIYNNFIYNQNAAKADIEIDEEGMPVGNTVEFHILNNTIQSNNGTCVRYAARAGLGPANVGVVQNNHCIGSTMVSWEANPVTKTESNNLVQSLSTANAEGYTLANFYQPIAGGSTIDAGISQATIFTTDKRGVTRSGTWDIGAYEGLYKTQTYSIAASADDSGAAKTYADVVLGTDGVTHYAAKSYHVASSTNRPTTGVDWAIRWVATASPTTHTWTNGVGYSPATNPYNYTSLYLPRDSTTTQTYFRWPVRIPKNASISSAYLQLYYAGQQSTADGVSTISLLDEDNAAAFSGTPWTRSVTNDAVTWTAGNLAGSTWVNSADVSLLIDSYIDRAGYSYGNYLGLRGSYSSGVYKQFYPYDYGPGTYPPRLVVNYTGGDAVVELWMAEPHVRTKQKVYCQLWNMDAGDVLYATLDGGTTGVTPDNYTILAGDVPANAADVFEKIILFDYTGLTAGSHTITITLKTSGGVTRGTATKTWTTTHSGYPKVGINEDNSFCVRNVAGDGCDLFFPISPFIFYEDEFYNCGGSCDAMKDNINILHSSGYPTNSPQVRNEVSYSTYLTKAAATGYKVVGPGGSWDGQGAYVGISSVTHTNPVVVTTASAHGFTNGQEVYFWNQMSGYPLRNTFAIVANATPTTFELSGVDGTSWAATLRKFTYGTGTTAPTTQQLLYGETSGAILTVDTFTNSGGWTGSGTGTINYYVSSGAVVSGEHIHDAPGGAGNLICITTSAEANVYSLGRVWYMDAGKAYSNNSNCAVADAAQCSYVNYFKSNAGVFGWHWWDEPNLSDRIHPTQLKSFLDGTHSKDTDHPVFLNLYAYDYTISSGSAENIQKYHFLYNAPLFSGVRTLLSDVTGHDYYTYEFSVKAPTVNLEDYVLNQDYNLSWNYNLVPGFYIIEVGDLWDHDGITHTPGCGAAQAASDYTPDPTAEQWWNQAWLAVIHGAKGLGYFGPDLFCPIPTALYTKQHDFKIQMDSLKNAILQPLSGKVTHDGTGGWWKAATVAGSGRVDFTVREYGGKIYVFAARVAKTTEGWPGDSGGWDSYGGSTIASETATFTISGLNVDTKVTRIGEGTSLVSAAGSFSDTFTGFDVHIYSYSETPVPEVTAPEVTVVTSSATDKKYGVGAIIPVSVTLSEAGTSAAVTVTCDTSPTPRTCNFALSNDLTGSCNIPIQAGDVTADMNCTVSGTITDADSNVLTNFTPPTAMSALKAIQIDARYGIAVGSGSTATFGSGSTAEMW